MLRHNQGCLALTQCAQYSNGPQVLLGKMFWGAKLRVLCNIISVIGPYCSNPLDSNITLVESAFAAKLLEPITVTTFVWSYQSILTARALTVTLPLGPASAHVNNLQSYLAATHFSPWFSYHCYTVHTPHAGRLLSSHWFGWVMWSKPSPLIGGSFKVLDVKYNSYPLWLDYYYLLINQQPTV